jgi:DNA-binding response OmpR family regulator
MRIAVLDKDIARADQICARLQAEGFACHRVTGETADGNASLDGMDLLIVDCQSTGALGDSAENFLRPAALLSGIPLLLLASRADEDVLAKALAAGVTDYLIHPLRYGELVTRVRVLLKRAYPDRSGGEQASFGAYVFEIASARLAHAGRQIDLTQKEFELALLFFRHLGRPLSRTYIAETIWTSEPEVASRTIDTHVSRVRSKLALRPENGYRLSPIYSFGYQLEKLHE